MVKYTEPRQINYFRRGSRGKVILGRSASTTVRTTERNHHGWNQVLGTWHRIVMIQIHHSLHLWTISPPTWSSIFLFCICFLSSFFSPLFKFQLFSIQISSWVLRYVLPLQQASAAFPHSLIWAHPPGNFVDKVRTNEYLHYAAWEVWISSHISKRPWTQHDWPLNSKTFLARLCEQAERYDGKSLRDVMVGRICWRVTLHWIEMVNYMKVSRNQMICWSSMLIVK